MLAGFAAYGKPSRAVGARVETALHGFADGDVFGLHFFTHSNAFPVMRVFRSAHFFEVKIKYYSTTVNPQRQDKIRVHDALIGIDHEVRIKPQVEGAPLPRRGCGSIGIRIGAHRAGLHAIVLKVFDGVTGVVEDAVQSLVQVGDVVAAVQIVVHIDLPIALQRVGAALEKAQFAEAERLDQGHQPAEKLPQRFRLRVEIDEDKVLPDFRANGKQSILRPVKIADAFELRNAFESAVGSVGPAVIRAAKLRGVPLGFGHYGGRMVAANVEEAAHHSVFTADDYNRLIGPLRRQKTSFLTQLICSANGLPGAAKHCLPLQFGHARVHVPGRGNGGGLRERRSRIVKRKDLLERMLHNNSCISRDALTQHSVSNRAQCTCYSERGVLKSEESGRRWLARQEVRCEYGSIAKWILRADRVGPQNDKARRRAQSGPIANRPAWRGRKRLLGQDVTQAYVLHEEMGILRRPGSHKPRRTAHVRRLGDQQHGAVLRVSPEGLGPIDGGFLNDAVLAGGATFVEPAEPDTGCGGEG